MGKHKGWFAKANGIAANAGWTNLRGQPGLTHHPEKDRVVNCEGFTPGKVHVKFHIQWSHPNPPLGEYFKDYLRGMRENGEQVFLIHPSSGKIDFSAQPPKMEAQSNWKVFLDMLALWPNGISVILGADGLSPVIVRVVGDER